MLRLGVPAIAGHGKPYKSLTSLSTSLAAGLPAVDRKREWLGDHSSKTGVGGNLDPGDGRRGEKGPGMGLLG